MKRLVFAILIGSVGTAGAQVTKDVLFSLTNPNTVAVCPATSPKACQAAITLEDITSLTPVIISQTITTTATSYTYPFSTPGTYTYAVFVTGFDSLGNPLQSAQTTTTVTIPAPFTLQPLVVKATLQ